MASQLKVRGAPIQFAPHVFAVQLANWIEFGIAPDSQLLHAILNNDLGRTFALIGSASSCELVHDTLMWLWSCAPPGCYGSRAVAKRWEEMGGKGGLHSTGRPLDELREQLARAEQEYMAAEFIDETDRQQRERAWWAAEIERLLAEIEARRIDRIPITDHQSWLAGRHQDLTASVAGALFGVHPYTTLYQVWAEKTGRTAPQEENQAMRRGTILEPIAVELLQRVHSQWQIEYPLAAYYRDSGIRLGATPDGFARRPDMEGRGVIQIKTTAEDVFRGWLDPDTGDVILPEWIAVQVLVEAHLTDADWASAVIVRLPRGIDELVEGLTHSGCEDVAGILRALMFAWLHLGRVEVHVVDVPLHPRLIARIREATAEFWRITDAGESPPPDWSRDGPTVLDIFRDSEDSTAMLADPETFERLAGKYAAAKQAENAAAKQAALLKPQIIAMLGNAERGETERWKASAPTVHRKAHEVRASSSRMLKVTDKAAASEKEAA